MTWLRRRDPALLALRRAARTALVAPVLLALGTEVLHDAEIGTFAVFGSFAMLMMVDFPGRTRARVQAEAWLAVAGGALVCAGTLCSRSPVLAAGAMALVAFCVLYAGIVSSVLAGATTSLLLAFILPVSLSAPASAIPERLAGWGMAAVAALLAVAFLWPAPVRDPVRTAAIAACRALARRLRAHVAYARGNLPAPELDIAVAQADAALDALQSAFLQTPYRPTGLSTAARAVVRLVDELRWLSAIVSRATPRAAGLHRSTGAVKNAAATLLERSADLLDAPRQDPDAVDPAVDELRSRLTDLQRSATERLPLSDEPDRGLASDAPVERLVSSTDPCFRAQELSFIVLQVAANVEIAAAAERRSWLDQLLGRPPAGAAGALSTVRERAASHLRRDSVWLQNSVRGSVGLAVAVAVASATGVQHSFWVVLGTLSVLRSSALSTGQSVIRGLLGTMAGFAVGAALVVLIGTDRALLWAVLPPAVLLAGLAPAIVGFAAGQAAFTVTLLILFNILAPNGWEIGLVRLEDVALGGAVSAAVGLLFWPRGAGGALGAALATAYRDSADYLAGTVRFGLGRRDAEAPARAPTQEAIRAAAAARRLDDALRTFLSERGSKPVALAEVTGLATGVVALRLAGDAVLDLWADAESTDGDGTAARRLLLASTERMVGWYHEFAASLTAAHGVPEPSPPDPIFARRLVTAVGRDFDRRGDSALATAVRIVWTGDHLDAARRLQATITEPAGIAVRHRALGPVRARRP